LLLLPLPGAAAARQHYVGFGGWVRVQFITADDAKEPGRVRALLVDGSAKEFVVGPPHDVTDRLFAVRRAFRMNDALPGTSRPQWIWQRGGWLLVDRSNGHVSKLNLPDFDTAISAVSWFRDYAAYCGSPDGQKLYAIVAQIGERKPLRRTALDDSAEGCEAPTWQKQPPRVTFTKGLQKLSFTIRGRAVEPQSGEDESER
jgi:hypothetical protein